MKREQLAGDGQRVVVDVPGVDRFDHEGVGVESLILGGGLIRELLSLGLAVRGTAASGLKLAGTTMPSGAAAEAQLLDAPASVLVAWHTAAEAEVLVRHRGGRASAAAHW
ncbi:hypothetical protein ABZ468_43200 [Streptomyces sp. NPDC005708]|uniref:hypothetical protein n=1 Tax=Streptomyces sp. NPDC005708 TaxID=3154564 RepID=UPI00340B427C